MFFRMLQQDCPNGRLTPAKFVDMYKMFFPSGNAEEFCDHVFRTFDMDKNGYIDFKVSPASILRQLAQTAVMNHVITTVLSMDPPKKYVSRHLSYIDYSTWLNIIATKSTRLSDSKKCVIVAAILSSRRENCTFMTWKYRSHEFRSTDRARREVWISFESEIYRELKSIYSEKKRLLVNNM